MTYTVSTPPSLIVGTTISIISPWRKCTWKSAVGGSSILPSSRPILRYSLSAFNDTGLVSLVYGLPTAILGVCSQAEEGSMPKSSTTGKPHCHSVSAPMAKCRCGVEDRPTMKIHPKHVRQAYPWFSGCSMENFMWSGWGINASTTCSTSTKAVIGRLAALAMRLRFALYAQSLGFSICRAIPR